MTVRYLRRMEDQIHAGARIALSLAAVAGAVAASIYVAYLVHLALAAT